MAVPLTVLVTVYNRQAYVADTLHSILNSTFTDFELIVVDDASTDNSAQVIRDIARKDNRIRLVENDKNLGDYANRAKAASLASGRYIKYVDSDDLIYPHSLAIMVESMEKYPAAVLGLSHSSPEEEKPYPYCLSPEHAYRKQYLGRGCLNCGPTGAIIQREQFRRMGGFDKSWGILSDTHLWLRMAAKSKVVLLPPGLVWWRKHPDQEYRKGNAEITYLRDGYKLDMEALCDPVCPLSPEDKSVAIARRRQHFARRLLSLLFRDKELRKAYTLYKDSALSPRDLAKGFQPYE